MSSPVLGLPPLLATLQRCLVMGVLNVTPDSFSDGGRFLDADRAIAHGLSMVRDGADLVDVGGESTRPGAARVAVGEELHRVLPVVRALAAEGVVVSIDTTRASVARSALAAGAAMVNDVSGGLGDEAMAGVVADSGSPYVVMHSRGPSADMATRADYGDVVTDVRSELGRRIDSLVAAGVDPGQLIVDPGLGFAKEEDHNWSLLRRLDVLRELGRPLLVGASRKRFLGQLLADDAGEPRSPAGRDDATSAVTVVAALAGAWGVRVHEVPASADAVRVVARLRSLT